jgi:hypothetical protein
VVALHLRSYFGQLSETGQRDTEIHIRPLPTHWEEERGAVPTNPLLAYATSGWLSNPRSSLIGGL